MNFESSSESLQPFTVVLTGGIASGKTAVSDLFRKLGIAIIDTDVIARDLVEPGRKVLNEVVQQFGDQMLLQDGHLDRKKLRDLVFNDKQERDKLESILHPAIHDSVKQEIQNVDSEYCILVIPLYAESGRYDWIHRVLVVDVPEEIQIDRVMARDGINRKQAEKILQSQASRDERLALADDVIVNSGSVSGLNSKVAKLHEKYLLLANSRNYN